MKKNDVNTNEMNINIILSISLGFCLMTASSLVFSDEQDTLNFVAGISSRYDDNLFRTVSNEQSDTATTFFAGIRLDKKYSLQRFTLNATVRKNSYKKNDYLNFTAKNYDAAWLWALTPRLTGKISANRSESLNNFNDTQNSLQNIRTQQNQAFIADYQVGGGWHALGGVSRNEQTNTQTLNAVNSDDTFSTKAVDFGVKYIFPSSSSITLMNHVRKGKFDDRQIDQASQFDVDYKEKETEVIVDWSVTAKSRVNLTTGYLKRESDDFSIRDFSGFQGALRYDWSPTAKINVGFNASSRLGGFQTSDDSYVRTNTFSILPRYAITPKIAMTSALNLTERRFLGKGAINASTINRVDEQKILRVGLEWSPTLNSTVGINLVRDELDSNDNTFDYKSNAATISGNMLF